MGEPLTSKFMDAQDSPISVSEYSGEEIDGWIRFEQNEFTVTPQNTTEYELLNGATVNAAGKIDFSINVPRDAEPGYHAGAINFNPQLDDAGTGFGASARGQSMYTFVFRVPGNVVRDLEVIDARGIRTGEDEARIDMRVANRGTVTTSIQGGNLEMYDRIEMSKVEDVTVGYHELAPGESTVISSNVRSGAITQGTFQVNGTLDYIGGSSFVSQQTFSLADTISQAPPDSENFAEPEPENEGTPIWLLVLLVLVIASVMYAFEFDLFSITLVAGGLGIIGFILMTGIPNWTLIILLTSTVVILMYG